jgi:hypothetical protein
MRSLRLIRRQGEEKLGELSGKPSESTLHIHPSHRRHLPQGRPSHHVSSVLGYLPKPLLMGPQHLVRAPRRVLPPRGIADRFAPVAQRHHVRACPL